MGLIYIVRHGKTDLQGRYCGRGSNPSLNAAGKQEILHLKSIIKQKFISRDQNSSGNNHVFKVMTSPLLRAIETAETLWPDSTRKTVAELAEFDFGQWEGFSHSELVTHHQELESDLYQNWLDNPENPPPDGESLQDFEKRVLQAYHLLVKESSAETPIGVAAHGGTIRGLLCIALKLPLSQQWQFQIDTGSLTILELSTQWPAVIRQLNVR